MKNQRYTTNTKTNNKNIFAIMIAIWLLLITSISQMFASIFARSASAGPKIESWYDKIVINTAELGLSDSDYTTLESAGWSKLDDVADESSSKFTDCIGMTVGTGFWTDGTSIDTAQVNLPISILEGICGTVQLKVTIGGVEKVYTNSSYTMSGYTSSDFSLGYDAGYYYVYVLLVEVVRLQTQNTLNLIIRFENIQYQGTSVPLYVFDNDTNDILSVTSVVQSASSTPINIDFDASITVRITLAVPYLWEIEWTNVEKFVNKSAIVDVSGEVVISAKVKVVSSYNNIIIV